MLTKAPKNAEIILGADVNARIGVRDREEYASVLGPNGHDGRNLRGEGLLQIYAEAKLKVENTFFTQSN